LSILNIFFCKLRQVRLALLLLCLVTLPVISACGLFSTHKTVGVAPVLALRNASTAELLAEINRLAAIKSLRGKLDVEFEDTSGAGSGLADKYRKVDASITVQRPGKVYFVIGLFSVDIAKMTSDGEHFRVAILKGDEKYKRFVKGTNNAEYGELNPDGNGKQANEKGNVRAERATVNALSNLRPQHLTDAFLLLPIAQPAPPGYFYSQSEIFEEEVDSRPQAKKGARVIRGYYLLEEFTQAAAGQLMLRRRYWFDRVGAINLARVETFDDHGVLETEVRYSIEQSVGTDPAARLPTHIELTRRKDQYRIRMNYQAPPSVSLDHDYPADVFVLENTFGLKEVDLDANRKDASRPQPR
jgi:hypothetical protein